MQRRSLVIVACSLAGCFSPEVSTETEVDGDGYGSSTIMGQTSASAETSSESQQPDTETTGVDPDTTATAGGTGSEDAPPVFESFTVNDSTEPAEVDEGGTIALEAVASDDVGVASVEFFDGDVSLGVDSDAPYGMEVAVSSADSGPHTYVAIATDTANQTSTSDAVAMSVNIIGGEIEVLRENLFRGLDGLAFTNGGLDVAAEDRVFLSGAAAGDGSSEVFAFNDDLSQIWSRSHEFRTPGRPIVIGDRLFIGGVDNDALTLVYRELSSNSGDTMDELAFATDADTPSDLIFRGLLARSGDRVVFHNSLSTLAAYSIDLVEEHWQANLAAAIAFAETEEHLFVSFGARTCAPGASFCVRRYNTLGQASWTAGLPSDAPALIATNPDGGAWAIVGYDDPGYQILRIDPEGEIELVTEATGESPYLSAATADGSGGFVIAGSKGDYASGRAFVARYDASGAQVWEQPQFFNNNVESAALDVRVDGSSIFVYGLANNVLDFLSFSGDAWVARLSL